MALFSGGVGDFANIAGILYETGILVGLLVFTIIFATLQKTQILGEARKNFNVIVALLLSLIVIAPHVANVYPAGYDIVDIVNASLPQVSLVAIAAIMLLLLVGIFGAESAWMGTSLSGFIAILAFILVTGIFLSNMGFTADFQIGDYIDDDTLELVIVILVFALIVWYIQAEPGKERSLAKLGHGLKGFGEFFGKK